MASWLLWQLRKPPPLSGSQSVSACACRHAGGENCPHAWSTGSLKALANSCHLPCIFILSLRLWNACQRSPRTPGKHSPGQACEGHAHLSTKLFLSLRLRTGILWSKGYHNCASPSMMACARWRQVGSNGFCQAVRPPPCQRRLPLPGLFLLLLVGRTVKGCQDKFSAPARAFSFSLPLSPSSLLILS